MAASNLALLSHSVVATAAITAGQAVTGAGAVAAAAARSLGTARTNAAIGERFTVDVIGTAVGTIGAAVANEALLEVNASGRYITRSAGVAVARALQAGAANGDQIEILLFAN